MTPLAAALQRAFVRERGMVIPADLGRGSVGDIKQQGRPTDAVTHLRSVLEDRTPDMQKREFDFSLDIVVINLLGQTLFDLGRLRARQERPGTAKAALAGRGRQFEKTPRSIPKT